MSVLSGKIDIADLNSTKQYFEINDLWARLQKKLQKSKKLATRYDTFKKFVDNSPGAFYQLDAKANVTYINKSLEGILGTAKEKMQGAGWYNYIHPESKAYIAEQVQEALQNQKGYHVICRMIRDDGSEFWIESKAEPHFNEGGKLKGYFGHTVDITERKELEKKLERANCFDDLTELANSKSFNQVLIKTILNSDCNNEKFALLYISIDNFERISDGIDAILAEKLLVMIALRLRSIIHEEDFLAKMDGSKYAVIMKKYRDESEILLMAERIIKRLQDPYKHREKYVHISVSLGAAAYPGPGCNSEEMKKRVTSALLHTKILDKGGFQLYDPAAQKKIEEQIKIENLLQTAILNKEFYLAYEPRMDAATRKMTAYEVLLRWENPDLGDVDPKLFIPVLKKSHILEKVGYWVLEAALSQHKKWRKQFTRQDEDVLPLVINVFSRQLENRKEGQNFIEIMKNLEALPSKTILEINGAISDLNSENLSSNLEKLKEHGVKIGVSGFGTGHSSISVIEKFPVESLKIHSNLVDELLSKKHSQTIAKAICSLSELLEFNVVAEGVKNEEQAEALTEMGCHALQGEMFSEPMHAHAFEENILKKM